MSASGFYAWLKRPESNRAKANRELSAHIKDAYDRSRGTYGAPRIFYELKFLGVKAGVHRISRLMRKMGLVGAMRRRFVVTTKRDERLRPAPDLVNRQFTANKPNQLWVADITYIPTWEGFLYLAVVLLALEMAKQQRKPKDVIHHSDQACQYTSIEFGHRLKESGIRPSMGTVADCYDNAMCESFFATLECEHLAKNKFKTRQDARMSVFEFIEGFYNPTRRHSSVDYLSPVQYEQLHQSRAG